MEYYNLSALNSRSSQFNTHAGGDQMWLFDIPSLSLLDGLREWRPSEAPSQGVSRAELSQILTSALSSLRVYVVEADITDAQNSIKTVVEQATF